jgi:hypothetical protein
LTGSPAVVANSGRSERFTIVAQPATSLAPGASTNFTVRFQGGLGTAIGTISIANNDPDEDPYNFVVVANINESIFIDGFE